MRENMKKLNIYINYPVPLELKMLCGQISRPTFTVQNSHFYLFPKCCFLKTVSAAVFFFFPIERVFLWKISPKLQKLVHLWQHTSQEKAVSSPECPIYIFPIILLSVSVLPGDSRNSAAIVSRS